MANQNIALNSASLATLAVDAVRNNDVGGLVNKTVASYKTMAGVLHQAACAALFHAAQTGDSRPLSALHAGMRKNDADALRIWVGKRTVVDVMQDDKELQVPYMTFNKDKGFAIKKATENYRVGHHDLEALLAGPSFQDVNQKAESVYDLKKLLAFLARVEKQADKKAETHGFEVPAELMGAIRTLTAASNKVAATLN